MPVYVDAGRIAYGRMKMCHMVADTLAELHAMAARIGLRRAWFQDAVSAQHYDVCQAKRTLAIAAGAVELGRTDFVAKIRELRAARAAGTGEAGTTTPATSKPTQGEG